jgi:hypothetical protein
MAQVGFGHHDRAPGQPVDPHNFYRAFQTRVAGPAYR